ncbi:MAG: fimbria/pilus periplasmic chaperone, partial [Pseudohongiellaceae bacterium]
MRRIKGLVLGSWCLASLCLGAELQVTPILQEIPSGETTAVYRVINTGEQSVTVQVTALAWQQENGVRTTSNASNIQINPPLMTLSPDQEEWVRVVLTTERSDKEQAFRVFFTQVPETAETLHPGVRTLIRFDTPLFFQAEEPQTDLQWALHQNPDGWHLQVRNTGTRFANLTRLVMETDGGRRLLVSEGVQYILPGTSHSWWLELTDDEALGGLSL